MIRIILNLQIKFENFSELKFYPVEISYLLEALISDIFIDLWVFKILKSILLLLPHEFRLRNIFKIPIFVISKFVTFQKKKYNIILT